MINITAVNSNRTPTVDGGPLKSKEVYNDVTKGGKENYGIILQHDILYARKKEKRNKGRDGSRSKDGGREEKKSGKEMNTSLLNKHTHIHPHIYIK